MILLDIENDDYRESDRLRIRGTVTTVLPGSVNRIELNFLPLCDPGKPSDSLVTASGESIKIND